jgi:hypothetical protein
VAVQTVFSNNLNPNAPNLTSRFTGATGFYIAAPLITAELEIDCYLQVYFPAIINEQVRNIPLGKIEDQSILLNLTDTETASVIPIEFVDTNLEMALLFLASDSTFLEVAVIKPDCTIYSLQNQLNELSNRVDLILNALEVTNPLTNASASNDDFNQLNLLNII